MEIQEFRDYCLAKKGATEGFPFGEQTLVFKVMEKMFALCGVEDFKSINLKCDPLQAIELRETYMAVNPGYHMSKKHWNTVNVNEDVDDKLLFQWVDDSYNSVVASLTKKKQEELRLL